MAGNSTREKFAKSKYDAVVVGSGPNGLTAAIVLLQSGCSVAVVEGQSTAGGGCRSAEHTLPGYINDTCSAVHPLGIGSPIFRTFPLEQHGLEWVHPTAPFAHPFDNGKAVVVHRSIDETAEQLGADAKAYRTLMNSLVPKNWDKVCETLREPWQMGMHPFALAGFGLKAMQSAVGFALTTFKEPAARGMFAGIAAHSALPLDQLASASSGLVLAVAAHSVGWPVPKGGAQQLTNALISYMKSLGGELIVGAPVRSMDDLPEHKYVLFDLTPRQILNIAGKQLPAAYHKQLEQFKYGPAVFKLDYALSAPVPWEAEGCRKAGTIHIGPTIEEIAATESMLWRGQAAEAPYVLLAQPSLFDSTRAPTGKHTLWAYCHIPHGSDFDMTENIDAQIERFAPGFKKTVIKRSAMNAKSMEQKNNNYVGGDINGGALTIEQLFTRPVLKMVPYSIPMQGAYICSSSTPPGGGVHGMCGFYAARAALNGWK